MNNKTTFLIAKNDFISGVSRILDIASTRNKRVYNTSQSNDIRGAYEQFKKEVKTQA